MSWHPSRASARPLDPAAPTRYRAATVQSRTDRSLLVQTADGHDRLLPGPSAPEPSLVGSTVLVANDYDWVVAVDAPDPVEAVSVRSGGQVVEILPQRFDRRLEHLQRHRHRDGQRIGPFRRPSR